MYLQVKYTVLTTMTTKIILQKCDAVYVFIDFLEDSATSVLNAEINLDDAGIISSETLVTLSRATWRHIPDYIPINLLK